MTPKQSISVVDESYPLVLMLLPGHLYGSEFNAKVVKTFIHGCGATGFFHELYGYCVWTYLFIGTHLGAG